MKIIQFLCFFVSTITLSQEIKPISTVTRNELEKKQYKIDSLANAVVLYEKGEAHIDNGDYDLVFEYQKKKKNTKS